VKELHFFDEKITDDRRWAELRHGTDAAAVRWRRQLATERRFRDADPTPIEASRRDWCGRYFFDETTVEWYRSLFPDGGPRGEITPDYATLDETQISAVVKVNPDIKVIYLLRNPVDREWSAAQMAIRSGRRDADSVLKGRHLQSKYHQNLTRWRRELKPGNLYVGFYEDLEERPTELVRDILTFIGADASAEVELPTGRPNAGNIATIPRAYARVLAERLHGSLETLAPIVGGPAEAWLSGAESLREIEDGPDLDYPIGSSAGPSIGDSLSSRRI
jgi:hypothetical protein